MGHVPANFVEETKTGFCLQVQMLFVELNLYYCVMHIIETINSNKPRPECCAKIMKQQRKSRNRKQLSSYYH